jgi:hypothetical protein
MSVRRHVQVVRAAVDVDWATNAVQHDFDQPVLRSNNPRSALQWRVFPSRSAGIDVAARAVDLEQGCAFICLRRTGVLASGRASQRPDEDKR